VAIPDGFRNIRELATPVSEPARNDSNVLKLNGNCRSLSGRTFQGNFCFMVSCGALDDGKAQTGAAGCFGVALVYPVEPLKHPVLVLRRNTHAGIPDSQAVVFRLYRDTAAG